MSLKAYLTIDDSPSSRTDQLTDYLEKNSIPAILFCRGDKVEQNPEPIVKAIKRGITVGNHSYSHSPAGTLTYDEIKDEIDKTEHLIDTCYKKAGMQRPGKYFRFAYIDRGDGDRLERRFDEIIADPSKKLPFSEKLGEVQSFLKENGFSQPFKNILHPLYQNSDVAGAFDSLFTYSSCDWMLTKRHLGNWPYKTLEDLKKKIDDDPWLCSGDGTQITLFHDQDETVLTAIELIDHMLGKGFEFVKTQ